jgi:hypothetical protein
VSSPVGVADEEAGAVDGAVDPRSGDPGAGGDAEANDGEDDGNVEPGGALGALAVGAGLARQPTRTTRRVSDAANRAIT